MQLPSKPRPDPDAAKVAALVKGIEAVKAETIRRGLGKGKGGHGFDGMGSVAPCLKRIAKRSRKVRCAEGAKPPRASGRPEPLSAANPSPQRAEQHH